MASKLSRQARRPSLKTTSRFTTPTILTRPARRSHRTSSFPARCWPVSGVETVYGIAPDRENVMRQAANFQKVRIPLLLPGINVSTSPTDFYPIQAVQLSRFKDDSWELFGDILAAESS